MSQATYTRQNQVNSWHLMVESQTVNLTPNLFFGHNLCFKCPNGRWEFILDIYISISFQWYKELFEAMGFDPYNCTLKIWKSIGTPTPNMEFTWACEGSFPHTLCTPGSMWCDSRVFLLAHNLATPCLGHEPKARVATLSAIYGCWFK
jgi:hypothetical protein